MRNAVLAAVTLFLGFAPEASAANTLPPASTTLVAETGNNTSASPAFLRQVNGNGGAGNVSKISIRTLLYSGSTTRIYAHVEPWWGSSSHMDIGYSSHDPSQVQRQVADIISRDLDGAAVDWYGPDSYEALGVKLLIAEAETHPGFGVFVEIDKGAIEWDSCYPTCNATTAVINLMTRVASDFFSSPAYVRMAGRPVVREFGMETVTLPSGQTDLTWNVVDWKAVQTQVPGNPLIVHRNLGGFAKSESGGAFAWMEPKTPANEPPDYDGADELNWFYSNAVATYSAMPAFGAVWKGFNDILASWAPPGGRHIEQNCGQTWLNTFAAVNRYYSQANQLAALQLITWNDYEEGTELESGIDNCVTVTATLSGSQLQWTITGDQATLDHYTVFLSSDGVNLARLGDLPTGTLAFDLSAFDIPVGTYSLFVKAVGKPSLRNQMSAPVTLTIDPPAPPPPPPPPPPSVPKQVTISVTPASVQIRRGEAAQFTLSLSETGASDPVSLSCSNLPSGASCIFSAATITPAAQASSVTLTISTSAMTAAGNRTLPLFAFWLPGVIGLVFNLIGRSNGFSVRQRTGFCSAFAARYSVPGSSRRAPQGIWFLLLTFVLALSLIQLACGGGGQTHTAISQPAATVTAAPPTSYAVTVTASSGSVANSTMVNLIVQ